MSYSLYLLPTASKDLARLPKEAYLRCRETLLALSNNPHPSGCKKLVGEDGYRVRVGEYRILYRIDEPSKRVYLYRVKHRKDVYR